MQLIFNRYSENTFSAVTKHRHRPPPAKGREEKKSRHVVYVHVKSCSEKGDRWIVRSALSAQKVHTQSKEKIGQWRWREIVTSMDVVAWGSGGARASGLRLTQLHGLWWRIYGLGSRERCLPENQASPTPFSPPPFFFFSFSPVSRFLLLLLLLLWSGADRHAMDISIDDSTLDESVRKLLFKGQQLWNRYRFFTTFAPCSAPTVVFFFFFWGGMMMYSPYVERIYRGNAMNLRKSYEILDFII